MEAIFEKIQNFATENINLYLLMLIVFSGIFIIKYTKDIWHIKDVYKVFFASIAFSIIFYFIDDCTENCAPQYLFTYLFATSFYELIMKYIIDKMNSIAQPKK